MTSHTFYLENQQLPNNELYKLCQDVLTVCNFLFFFLSHLLSHLSPRSKESFYYKALIHFQAVLLFLFCFLYTVLLKYVTHLNYGFYYCEGYFYMVGLKNGHGYMIMCFLFGCYAATIITSYLFRLYILVDHTHFLRIPHFLPIVSGIIAFLYAVVPAVAFLIGHSEFDPTTLPFNLTQEQLDYLYSKSVLGYKVESFREAFYPIYFVIFASLAAVSCITSVCIIVRHIRKKQSLSVGTTKHHLRVLKILTIQASCLLFVTCFAPASVTLTLFVDLESHFTTAFVIIVGCSSMIHSLLTIYLNPTFRKTLLNLLKFQISIPHTSVLPVESTYK